MKKWHRPLSFVKLNFRDALKSQQSYLDFMDNFVKSVQIYPYHCFFTQGDGLIKLKIIWEKPLSDYHN